MATQRIPPVKAVAHVKVTDNGQVDQPEVHLSKSGGDQVEWSAGKAAKIVFESAEGSPFDETTFRVPAGGSVPSGPIREKADAKEYKYTVYGATGKNDPTVIIHN